MGASFVCGKNFRQLRVIVDGLGWGILELVILDWGLE